MLRPIRPNPLIPTLIDMLPPDGLCECGPGMRAGLEQCELSMLGGAPGKVNAGCGMGFVPLASLAALFDCESWLGLQLWAEREDQKVEFVGLRGPARLLVEAKIVVVRAGRDASGTFTAWSARDC